MLYHENHANIIVDEGGEEGAFKDFKVKLVPDYDNSSRWQLN